MLLAFTSNLVPPFSGPLSNMPPPTLLHNPLFMCLLPGWAVGSSRTGWGLRFFIPLPDPSPMPYME